VTILLCLPGSAIPKLPGITWMDKLVHVGLFTILTMLWCRSFFDWKIRVNKLFIILALLSLAYGIAMEFVQKNFISNRSFDIMDMAADGLGSLIGFLISINLYKKINPCGNRGRNQN
jgi:VanZ family protein